MRETLERLFRTLFFNTPIWDLRLARKDRMQQARDQQAVVDWEAQGRPVPPPDLVKRTTLADFGAGFQIDTLIETGTFLGGTINALKSSFSALYTIELSPELATLARRRFRASPHVHVLQGDSGQLLSRLLETTTVPCLFWLDGHYSGGITAKATLDTPILQELETIFAHPIRNHVILIDDARLFNGAQDYPTIDQLRNLVERHRPDFQFSIANDIIRAHPARDVQTKY